MNKAGGAAVQNPPANVAATGLAQGDPPEKEVATQSGILAWEIAWTREPGRLQSMGSQSQTHTEHTHTLMLSIIHRHEFGGFPPSR